ncbi:hypothetical protein C8J56DRAFT_1047770 [Mycena floridula]|nr:hypothetical protein C8J56DRAFT_1047770 [Mycena floridula]
MLPAGALYQTLQTWWTPNIPSFQSALYALLESSLIEHHSPPDRNHRNRFHLYALSTLAWRTRPRTEIIEHAVKLLSSASDQRAAGGALRCYGWILRDLAMDDEALDQFKLSRQAYLAASEPGDAAPALLDIAMLSASIDSQTDEIPLIQQAQLELKTIQRNRVHQFSRPLLSFRNWFTKGVSQKSKEASAMDNEDMEEEEAEKWGLLEFKEWMNMSASDDVGSVLMVLGMLYISKNRFYLEKLEDLKRSAAHFVVTWHDEDIHPEKDIHRV